MTVMIAEELQDIAEHPVRSLLVLVLTLMIMLACPAACIAGCVMVIR